MIEFNGSFNLDVEKLLKNKELKKYGLAQTTIDSECIRLQEKYTPKQPTSDGGSLIRSVTKLTDIGSGEIRQGGKLAPYGKKWYYVKAKFTDAPIRGNNWFGRMLQNGGKEIILQAVKRKLGLK